MTRISSTLETILTLLHDRVMDDVLLREGEPILMRKGERTVPVSREPLAREQILRMFDGGGAAAAAETVWPEELALADGRRTAVTVNHVRAGVEPLQVVLARRRADSEPSPAHLDRRTEAVTQAATDEQ